MKPIIVTPCPDCGNRERFERVAMSGVQCKSCGLIRYPTDEEKEEERTWIRGVRNLLDDL